jgi:hypothetical protein
MPTLDSESSKEDPHDAIHHDAGIPVPSVMMPIATGRKLVFMKSLWKQEGEFQKDKANVMLPDHWASELGSI